MKHKSILLFVLISTFFSSCSFGFKPNLTQSILLIKDKDGLYIFDFATKKEQLIFKANDKQVFLDEPYSLNNDTLIVGVKGELIFNSLVDSLSDSEGSKYSKDYYSIDLRTYKYWISKKIFYEVIGHNLLKIRTQHLKSDGQIIIQEDTSMTLKSTYSTYKGITYNSDKPRFYTSYTSGDKVVFNRSGNIYLVDNKDTSILVKFSGNFDPKFGSGYYQPRLDPNNQYVIFSYLPGFMNFKEDMTLQRIDLKTKKIDVLKEGQFNDTYFSNDSKFLLFKRNERKGTNNTWISNIYVLDLVTLKKYKISEAYSAFWIKK